jgi:antitoxin CcdA
MRIKDRAMARYDTSARKRPVNLTLNEDLVAQARSLTENLSGVVEHLLADFVERSGQDREQRAAAVAATIDVWNAHGIQHGSIADEYSTL